ncbi:hypothetical protein NA8A_13654 [Nitratireductor indicus C115]|uniref:Arc-like DNA binding domain-containing protein n=1 Tax=Nitratireductor indicus C115 TaxID=1231190 RepID=K2P2U2_9HYPH|nr:Arc family DNA-binding protein [Nitratireductor indicus]EKF41666.1 hypothetical protein NA8A_13654 [Nitratireductor indicus C115]
MAENRSKSDGFMLRFPDGLRDRIKEAARRHDRSMNAELIARITEHDNLHQFWMTADSEIAKLEAQASQAQELREEIEKLREKVEELRGQVAYQEGVTAAYRDSLLVFAQRMKGSKEDGETLLKEIAKEIAGRGKGEGSDE